MTDAIEPNQSAFVKGRLLVENVLLASELVNGYHKSSISTRCAIKFDIAKAFDTVKWSFIVKVLQAMNLPCMFINWIHICISTASFSVAVNGGIGGLLYKCQRY
uniref:Reverse transcriptase domain-containing protein n=1 Tax=Noccaea caerulescens TaxID=107243 RepID=A0A1J3G2Y7_NOCCA